MAPETPPDVAAAIDRIAKYLQDEGYESAVIVPGGGVAFDFESILTKQDRLYRVIDTLRMGIETAEKTTATTRSILAKVVDVDAVFKAFVEHDQRKAQEKAKK